MEINQALLHLYKSYWQDLILKGESIVDPVPTNPLLLSLDEETYLSADLKIVICGQETWGWSPFGDDIVATMNLYWRFFVLENFYDGYGRSSFWKAFRYFKTRLAERFPSKRISFVWENLSKLGRNDGRTGVTEDIRGLERNYFPVLSEEIRILKPDIVIFLTGPNRDHDILFHFPDARFEAAPGEPNKRRLCRIAAKDLPSLTFRAYHPSYYRGFDNQLKKLILNKLEMRKAQEVDAPYRYSDSAP